jgi:hypothetical protein
MAFREGGLVEKLVSRLIERAVRCLKDVRKV